MQFRVSALKNLWTVCCSVAKLCPFLCDPMDCSMSGFPLLHYLPEFAQTHILNFEYTLELHHFSSVAQSCPTICDPMNRSMLGLPVHHQLLKSTQTHVHRVDNAIQPSQPLLSPFPPAPNPSQHQSLFQWVNSLHEMAKVLEFSFSIILSKDYDLIIR